MDFHGRLYIIEMKIWHGEEYNTRGEEQLMGFIEDFCSQIFTSIFVQNIQNEN